MDLNKPAVCPVRDRKHQQVGRHFSRATADFERYLRRPKSVFWMRLLILGDGIQMDFAAAAVLKKWPSKNNERVKDAPWSTPYLVFDGTLDECIAKFLKLPLGQRHLYEIHTAPQGELIPAVISSELAVEIARLRDFL